MGNGERGTGNGEWETGNGERGTGNGERGMGNGERLWVMGGRWVADGRWLLPVASHKNNITIVFAGRRYDEYVDKIRCIY
jgi:hypothetical protein